MEITKWPKGFNLDIRETHRRMSEIAIMKIAFNECKLDDYLDNKESVSKESLHTEKETNMDSLDSELFVLLNGGDGVVYQKLKDYILKKQKEVIDHISLNEGWEETGDLYRKDFGFKSEYGGEYDK